MINLEINLSIPLKKIINKLLLLNGLIIFKEKLRMLLQVHGTVLSKMEPNLSLFLPKELILQYVNQRVSGLLEDQILQKKDFSNIKEFLMCYSLLMKIT